jgi:hypothetical protein
LRTWAVKKVGKEQPGWHTDTSRNYRNDDELADVGGRQWRLWRIRRAVAERVEHSRVEKRRDCRHKKNEQAICSRPKRIKASEHWHKWMTRQQAHYPNVEN